MLDQPFREGKYSFEPTGGSTVFIIAHRDFSATPLRPQKTLWPLVLSPKRARDSRELSWTREVKRFERLGRVTSSFRRESLSERLYS